MSTEKQHDEWKMLAEAATPGPWEVRETVIDGRKYGGAWVERNTDDGDLIQISGSDGARSYTARVVGIQDHDDNDANAAFIAAARLAVPELLADIAMLRAEIQHLRDRLNPTVTETF